MKYIAIMLLITATSIITSLITQRHERKVVKERVDMWYGEGDYGLAVNKYLLTGDTTAFYSFE